MEVVVEVKTVYGNQKIYPVNVTAHLFAELTGKKTFSTHDLKTITALGYDVVQVATPIKLAA